MMLLRILRYMAASLILFALAPSALLPGTLARVQDALYARLAAHMGQIGPEITEVSVTGNRVLDTLTVLDAAKVAVGDPLLSTPVDDLKRRVESLAWVETAGISRSLDGVIGIDVREQVPIARWLDVDGTALINGKGQAFTWVNSTAHDELFLASGIDAPQAIPALLDLISERPDLADEIVSARRRGKRRWDLRFADGLLIKLPEDAEASTAWADFDRARLEQALGATLAMVDLRFGDRLVVRQSTEESDKVTS